jgi:transcriptional regulator with XRE-family HTH domain
MSKIPSNTGGVAQRVEAQLRVIGPALRSVREGQGLSQRQLAALIGIEQPQISAIETGRPFPGLRTLLLLLDALGAPMRLPDAKQPRDVEPGDE